MARLEGRTYGLKSNLQPPSFSAANRSSQASVSSDVATQEVAVDKSPSSVGHMNEAAAQPPPSHSDANAVSTADIARSSFAENGPRQWPPPRKVRTIIPFLLIYEINLQSYLFTPDSLAASNDRIGP
ncbi:hypothetical protein BV25DRAFT_748293 [Artomyces pyxidatus]|uniref:Uncharacterized protein n=1 Tax=Artomyces pyxidatus TaxID=48021 RepID=A0ACB8SZ63_9AGAM|nr:hypothetical protein BV25DRAFT_748293 [Artomyces pyxidatus]